MTGAIPQIRGVVYSKPPFGGPEAVLAYLSCYTIEWLCPTIASSAPTPTRWRSAGRIPRQERRSPEGDSLGHAGVHPSRPDALPARRVPPHPALQPTRGLKRKPRQYPCVALRPAPPEQASAQKAEPEVTTLTLRKPCPCCSGLMRIIVIFRRRQKPMSRTPPRERTA